MKNPKISIVSITYNQEKFIREALESFVTQKTQYSFEVIVADDASSDNTQKIIQEYAREYPDIIKPLIRSKNLGIHENLISAMQAAKGDYIALCEGDDYWTDPGKLQRQAEFLERNPDYTICFNPTRVFYDEPGTKETIWPNLSKKAQLTPEELVRENFIPTNGVMYRKLKYTNVPANVMPLDWYLHLYHARFGKIGIIEKVMSVYRRHEGGVWASSYKDTDQLWKTYGLSQVALFVEVLKLYQDSATMREATYNSLASVLGKLMDIDKRHGTDLLQQALNEYPEALGAFMDSSSKEKEELHDKDRHIEELNKEIVSLREQLFELKGQLHQIRRTPVIGHLIRLKALLGRIRRKLKHLHGRSYHYLREGIRVALPAPLRRALKGVYRFDLRAMFASARVVTNRTWPTNKPLVSVVIPYYNRADTVDDTLSSLATQTFRNFEVIIVDDGSTEQESVDKLVALQSSGTRILHQHNQGVAAARNAGIKEARGKYIICLDSDDMLDPTYIEKCTLTLEANPDVGLVTTHQDMFGITNELFKKSPYDANSLYSVDNMVITAAEFRREAWQASGGYKPGIGYEDWEFWISLAENGFWGKLLPEGLFKYRTAMQSRFVDDKGEMHWKNIQTIRGLHPKYKARIKKIQTDRQYSKQTADPRTAFVNLSSPPAYQNPGAGKPRVLITVPWMTFGGAETLIYNYCREIKEQFDISFVTGLKSEHEWEYKFREISGQIYHMANMFDDEALYLEFVSNYIHTRDIQVLHIIHNGFTFAMLSELKRRFPHLKVAVTLFNDRVAYFEQSIEVKDHIDAFSTDNSAVAKHYLAELGGQANVTVIPNGINCFEEYSPNMFNRTEERRALGLKADDLGVIFVGRLSEEKNPDVFIKAARTVIASNPNIRFYVVGSGPMKGKIEKWVKETGSKQLVYLGYQASPARFLAATDIFVLPSSIEGFPLSILEAMAMSNAVIASRVGAIPDVLRPGENGYVVSPGSAAEISDFIVQLRHAPALLKTIKTTAREDAESKYSTIALGQHYAKLYADLLK